MELYYKYLITLVKQYNYKKILNIINIKFLSLEMIFTFFNN